MYAVSDQFLEALRSPHSLATRAQITPTIGAPFDLDIISGEIREDRTAAQRRSATLTIDPRLYPTSPSDPVNPLGAEIKLWRGIRYGNHDQELVPQGVFRVDAPSRTSPGGGLDIELSDRTSQLADERFLAPRRLGETTGVLLIQQLISEVYPAAAFSVSTTDATTIPKHVVQQDRLEEITRVAGVCGVEVFADRDGVWVIQDIADPSTIDPVWDVDAGMDGVLVDYTDTTTRIDAPNIIIATGESTSGTTSYKSQFPHGYDTDPASPTYYLGAYGAVPKFYSSPLIRSQAQANKVADSLLNDHKGLIRNVTFNIVPNPALAAGDVITLRRADGTHENHMIDALTIPLGPSDAMTGETRVIDWGAA